jgi:hypothetical protein
VYWALSRSWKTPWTALSALTLYHAVPALFQVQAVAYLTNAFANAIAVMAAAIVATTSIRSLRGIVPAAALTLLAFVSHAGTLALLAATLAVTAVALAAAGDEDARGASVPIAAILIVSALMAFGAYYRHFPAVYARILERPAPGAATVAPAEPEVPVQRAEAHQTQWAPGWVPLENRIRAVPRYAHKYLGLGILVLAAAGTGDLVRRRARDRLSIVLLAWTATCVAFLIVGLVTPIDVRYYLAAAPAICVLAARGMEAAWPRRRVVRLAALSLYAWTILSGVAYWFAWFSPPLPR